MSFFNSMGKVAVACGKHIIEDAEKRNKRILKYKDRNNKYDDQKLMEKYRHSSGEEKIACAMLLKERGYGND
ncbi:hypothetical protein [Acetivibrio ethanolgignens]|uniref:Uncharacterized protein n=1 Tax=Acetivibrio ethanolgignens TaxID=290052 RepID=A0A0V8QGH5_9FIRM|nr:hypothetical protein [Acetivibrio ethanolgignens]KSV59507.1 hypothetical protein ASU35_08330 [Acetivibrio ethanolgignens]